MHRALCDNAPTSSRVLLFPPRLARLPTTTGGQQQLRRYATVAAAPRRAADDNIVFNCYQRLAAPSRFGRTTLITRNLNTPIQFVLFKLHALRRIVSRIGGLGRVRCWRPTRLRRRHRTGQVHRGDARRLSVFVSIATDTDQVGEWQTMIFVLDGFDDIGISDFVRGLKPVRGPKSPEPTSKRENAALYLRVL